MYVVKATVPRGIAAEWQRWMRKHHIPKLLDLPAFTSATMRVVETGDKDLVLFVMQYEAVDRTALESYLQSDVCVALRAEFHQKYGDSVGLSREIWNEIT